MGNRSGPAVAGLARAEIDDGGDRATAVRTLVRGGHGDEHRGVTGHRRGHTTDAGLDLPVPVHVRVVEHGIASPAYLTVLRRLALAEHIDQASVEVGGARTLRQVETGVGGRLPDTVGVQRVAHHRMADPVPTADT